MYGKGGRGVDVVKIGEIKVSVQELGIKQGVFFDRNGERYSERSSRTKKCFHCCLGALPEELQPQTSI